MTKSQDTYLARKQAGICTRCGQNPAEPGHVLCEQCRESAANERQTPEYKERQRARAAKRYREQKATGICTQCHSRPIVPGKTMCEVCAPKAVEAVQRRKETRLMQGLCFHCGKEPVIPGKNYGLACKEYFRSSYDARKSFYKRAEHELKANGICITCKTNSVSGKHVICDSCLEKGRERWRKRKLTSLQYQIVERDGFHCALCGLDKKLIVHHIDGQGHTSSDTPNDDPANLITLCTRCHACITHLRTLSVSDRAYATQLILASP